MSHSPMVKLSFSLLVFASLTIMAADKDEPCVRVDYPVLTSPERQLLVGAAEVDISPEVGSIIFNGYSDPKSTIVADPLKVKVIIIGNGGLTIGLGLYDNMELDRSIYDALGKRIKEQTGIDGSQILFSATHTHSGVSIHSSPGYRERMLDGGVEVFKKALESMRPCGGAGRGVWSRGGW